MSLREHRKSFTFSSQDWARLVFAVDSSFAFLSLNVWSNIHTSFLQFIGQRTRIQTFLQLEQRGI